MAYDEMELDTIGDRKTALFVIMSDTDDTFNFVVPSCSPSSSICSATRQTTSTAEGCLFMCGVC